MNVQRGKEYDTKVTSEVKKQMTLRRKRKGGHKKTVDEIKDQIGIRSRTTIYNIMKRDTTAQGRLERRMRRGANRLLSLEQENIVCGYLVTRAIVHKNTSSAVLRTFIREHFGKEVQPSWISKFVARNSLSFRRAKAKRKANIEESDEISMQQFLKRIHAKKKDPIQICCLDKTSIYSQTVYPLQIGPIGGGTLSRETPPKNHKVTIFTMVVGNGTVGGFYALIDKQEISANVVPAEDSNVLMLPNANRRGERSTIAYLEWCVSKGYLVAGDLLLTDNEASFKTDEVQNYLGDNEIEVDYFPPYRGSIMNPCDNSFHATFKQKYDGKILDKATISMEEKLRLAREAYFEIDEISIKHMFQRTGLTSRDISRTVANLSTEGLHVTPKNEKVHFAQVKAFIKWAKEREFSFDRESESELLTDTMEVTE